MNTYDERTFLISRHVRFRKLRKNDVNFSCATGSADAEQTSATDSTKSCRAMYVPSEDLPKDEDAVLGVLKSCKAVSLRGYDDVFSNDDGCLS